MSSLKVLLIGASGYIGGSVLTRFLESSLPAIKSLSISALVRSQEHADVIGSLGVNCIKFKDLDEVDFLEHVARDHDIVIHCGAGSHGTSGPALIAGLSYRKQVTSNPVFYIRTSGTSNLADRPISNQFIEVREFSDQEDIYSYEEQRDLLEPYPQRTADLRVIAAGEETDVPVYIIMPPLIYGRGDGPLHRVSMQIPSIARAALKWGHVGYIGDGTSQWDHVHIHDVAALYEVVTARILSGIAVPSGKRGFIFSGAGRHRWIDLARGVARAGVELGCLQAYEPKQVPLEKAANEWAMGLVEFVELGFGSRSLTNSVRGRDFGWVPQKTEAEWEQTFLADFKTVISESS